MRGVNEVFLIGNVTKDTECKQGASGNSYARFSIAISKTWFDKQSNSRKESVMFINCVAFGKTAEIAGKYLTKGTLVYVKGSLSVNKFTGQDGVAKVTTEVIVNDLTMLGGKASNSENKPDYQLDNYFPEATDTPERTKRPKVQDEYTSRPAPVKHEPKTSASAVGDALSLREEFPLDNGIDESLDGNLFPFGLDD